MKIPLFLLLVVLPSLILRAETRHATSSAFPSYEGRVMAGYQGWFRAPGDGSGSAPGREWGHYAGKGGKFDPENLTIDLWPDVSEYEKTYETAFTDADGKPARVFSSWDASTVDLHFRWMKEYGIDGAFMQRFYNVTRNPETREKGRVILGHALEASKKHGRALAVMYDLSGIRPDGDCDSIIEDWKELVDTMKITSQGGDQTYLYHEGKPLVAIWGLGFPDRPYDIKKIGVAKLIDFLKNDPEYGGCAVMLGVPTYFRTLDIDCLPDPYLHEVMKKADIVLPWTVQRFTPSIHAERARYAEHVKSDLEWCTENGLDYAPCITPGFSWYHLSKVEFDGSHPLNQIPRQKGRFYWDQISGAIESGAKMLYIAMFDELDEGTAIFKCTNTPPEGVPFVTYEGQPSDTYLWLTGEAGRMLRKDLAFTDKVPERAAD